VTEDIKAVVDAFGGKPMCTLIGGLTSPDRAALYNGCLVRYLDFMDGYLRPEEVNHPCNNIMAILAVAEHLGSSGKDFATAVAIAFEIQNHLLDLPTMRAGEIRHHAAGLLGRRRGKQGSRPRRRAHGLFQIVRDRLDTDWTTEWFAYAQRSSIKKYNAEFQSQSAIDLAIDLRDTHNIDVEKINSMHVEVAQGAYDVLAGSRCWPAAEGAGGAEASCKKRLS
jgi:2-methylcitrate dehydratase PrpD